MIVKDGFRDWKHVLENRKGFEKYKSSCYLFEAKDCYLKAQKEVHELMTSPKKTSIKQKQRNVKNNCVKMRF